MSLEVSVTPRGYRIASKISRVPPLIIENLINDIKTLKVFVVQLLMNWMMWKELGKFGRRK